MKPLKNKHYKCHTCEKIYDNKGSLSRHKKVQHTPQVPVNCPHCKKLVNLAYLKQHIGRSCSGNVVLTSCPKCQKIVKKATLPVHLKTHGDGKHTCEICLKVYSSMHTFNKHQRDYCCKINVDSQTHPCKTCGKFYSSKYALKRHEVQHSPSRKRVSCHLCCKPVFAEYYNIHIRKCCRPKNDFRCYFCKIDLKYGSTLANHLRSFHTRERPYPCHQCSYRGAGQDNIWFHKKSWHSGKKDVYPCYFCAKPLGSKGGMKRHLVLNHTKEKPWKCEYCAKYFHSTNAIKSHIKIHEADNTNFKLT